MRFRLVSTALGLSMLAATASVSVAQQGGFDCQKIPGLMAEREKAGKALQAANKRKADVKTACRLFRHYISVEANTLNFLRKNKTACGVPDHFLKQLASSHAKASQASNNVCQAAANGGGGVRPPSAGLSNALGVNTVGGATSDKPSAVFDTLHGNVLAQ